MDWDAMREAGRKLGLGLSGQPDPITRRVRHRDRNDAAAERPANVYTMIGQDQARTEIMLAVKGARHRNVIPPHILLSGPPGLGKTSLAGIVAMQTGGQMIEVMGKTLNDRDARLKTLQKLRWKNGLNGVIDVLFVDEIHELSESAETALYTVMEDFKLSVSVGRGKDADTRTIKVAPFVLVGATTLPGKLTQPLLDRFGIRTTLNYYTAEQLMEIINGRCGDKIKIDQEAALYLAERSRWTPRVALNLLDRAHDYAVVMADDPQAPITVQAVEQALAIKKIDSLGLTQDDLAVLNALCRVHRGGPVGEIKLASAANIDRRTLTATIEPYLVRSGLMRPTTRGRMATEAAFDHLKITCPAHCQDASEEEDE